MLTINTLQNMRDNDGMTLKNGQPVKYKSGWQVALSGIETRSAAEALKAVKDFGENCGIWFSDGIYYIDQSIRVSTKREALTIGRLCNQISVLCWRNMKLAYC